MKCKVIFGTMVILIITVFVFTVTTSVFAESSKKYPKKLGFIKKIDKDNDGRVSKEEYLAKYTEKFDRLDANKDGYIDKDEAVTKMKKKGIIKRMDKDNDLKVSKEEFQGSDEEFDRLDANKDGYINKGEAIKGHLAK
ncbi:MAG: EF-hand domain-containing protein [Thermodesulfobacteriota bacterium]|nr:EF-hand domain-containing protein [Thermodesulfobacteriota bacterium]